MTQTLVESHQKSGAMVHLLNHGSSHHQYDLCCHMELWNQDPLCKNNTILEINMLQKFWIVLMHKQHVLTSSFPQM